VSVNSRVLLTLAALIPCMPLWAQGVDARLDQLFGEHNPYRSFFQELKTAVAAQDRTRVAGMVSYPLTVRLDGHPVQLKTPQELLAHYAQLLPPSTQQALASQSYEALFVNSQGVMIGNGQIWFSGVCQDERCSVRPIKIIAFNP
jgi:hypothetical protein